MGSVYGYTRSCMVDLIQILKPAKVQASEKLAQQQSQKSSVSSRPSSSSYPGVPSSSGVAIGTDIQQQQTVSQQRTHGYKERHTSQIPSDVLSAYRTAAPGTELIRTKEGYFIRYPYAGAQYYQQYKDIIRQGGAVGYTMSGGEYLGSALERTTPGYKQTRDVLTGMSPVHRIGYFFLESIPTFGATLPTMSKQEQEKQIVERLDWMKGGSPYNRPTVMGAIGYSMSNPLVQIASFEAATVAWSKYIKPFIKPKAVTPVYAFKGVSTGEGKLGYGLYKGVSKSRGANTVAGLLEKQTYKPGEMLPMSWDPATMPKNIFGKTSTLGAIYVRSGTRQSAVMTFTSRSKPYTSLFGKRIQTTRGVFTGTSEPIFGAEQGVVFNRMATKNIPYTPKVTVSPWLRVKAGVLSGTEEASARLGMQQQYPELTFGLRNIKSPNVFFRIEPKGLGVPIVFNIQKYEYKPLFSYVSPSVSSSVSKFSQVSVPKSDYVSIVEPMVTPRFDTVKTTRPSFESVTESSSVFKTPKGTQFRFTTPSFPRYPFIPTPLGGGGMPGGRGRRAKSRYKFREFNVESLEKYFKKIGM